MHEAVFFNDVAEFIYRMLRGNVHRGHAYVWDGQNLVQREYEGIPVTYIVVD